MAFWLRVMGTAVTGDYSPRLGDWEGSFVRLRLNGVVPILACPIMGPPERFVRIPAH